MSGSFLRRAFVVVSVLLTATLVARSGAQEPTKPVKKDPAEVMKSLEQLLKDYADENATLKQRVKDLEAQLREMKEKQVVTRVVPQPGAPSQVPPTWKAVPFNGGTYYIVPLSDLQPRPQDPVRLPIEAAGQLRSGDLVVTPARPAAPAR